MPAPDVMGMLMRLLQSSPPAATPLGGTDQQFAQSIAQQAGVGGAPDQTPRRFDTEGEDFAPSPPAPPSEIMDLPPRDLIEALSKYPPGSPGADPAYWNYLREQYGAAPPDQRTGAYPQTNVDPEQGDRGIWRGPPVRRSESATVGVQSPLTYPGRLPPRLDYRIPTDAVWSDMPPTHYSDRGQMIPVPVPRDPWDMLRTSPLNQMFGARRIPGLY